MQIRTAEGWLDVITSGVPGGARPALVLLHGIQGTASVWGPLLADLSRDRMVLAPNLRGRAGSWSPDDPDAYALSGFVSDLMAVLEAVPGPVVLVGWSMGSLVAMEYLRHSGADRLAGIALVSGTPCLAATGGADAVWFRGDSIDELARDAAGRAGRLQLAKTATDIAVAGSWLAAQSADFRDLLPRINVPALVIHGEDDPECPVAHGRILARGIPDASLSVWPACGHVPMSHDSARFVAEMRDFLKRCDQSPG